MQDTKKIINQLNKLEKSGIGLFHNVISIYGLEKVKETLDLYFLGSKYGFGKQELMEILSPIISGSENKETVEIVSQEPVEEEIVSQEPVEEEIVSQEPVEEITTVENVVFISESVSEEKNSDFLMAQDFTEWVGEEDLNLSPLEVCQFFNKTPHQKMRNRFCKYFKQNKIPSYRSKNCLRYSTNVVDRYKIPVDVKVISDLREIADELEMEEPTVVDYIPAYDFLDGTQCDFYLLDNQDTRLNVVVKRGLVSKFEENNSQFSYFENNEEGSYKDNPRNLLFLGRSMEFCFYEKSISSLCKSILEIDFSRMYVKDISSHVRAELDKIRVRNLWDTKEMSLSKRMQGRVYLLTYMLIVYRAQDLNILPII